MTPDSREHVQAAGKMLRTLFPHGSPMAQGDLANKLGAMIEDHVKHHLTTSPAPPGESASEVAWPMTREQVKARMVAVMQKREIMDRMPIPTYICEAAVDDALDAVMSLLVSQASP